MRLPLAFTRSAAGDGSFFGDLHIYGPDGVRFYTKGKVTMSQWNGPAGMNLQFPTNTMAGATMASIVRVILAQQEWTGDKELMVNNAVTALAP